VVVGSLSGSIMDVAGKVLDSESRMDNPKSRIGSAASPDFLAAVEIRVECFMSDISAL
jgi:hypothetical protein